MHTILESRLQARSSVTVPLRISTVSDVRIESNSGIPQFFVRVLIFNVVLSLQRRKKNDSEDIFPFSRITPNLHISDDQENLNFRENHTLKCINLKQIANLFCNVFFRIFAKLDHRKYYHRIVRVSLQP